MLAVNTTSSPSTNESAAASEPHRRGRREREARRRASSGSTTSAIARRGEPRRRVRRAPARRAGARPRARSRSPRARSARRSRSRRAYDQSLLTPRTYSDGARAASYLSRSRNRRRVPSATTALRRWHRSGDRPSVEVSPSGNERNLVNTASKPALTIGAHRRASCAIGLVVLGLGYLHFATGDDPVSVPTCCTRGPAHRWSRVTTRPRTAATPPTAARSSCPENRADPRSRLIALPVTRIRARSAQPGSSGLPARGRPRHHQHGVREGEPVRR